MEQKQVEILKSRTPLPPVGPINLPQATSQNVELSHIKCRSDIWSFLASISERVRSTEFGKCVQTRLQFQVLTSAVGIRSAAEYNPLQLLA